MQSFETEILAEDANFAGLAGLSRALIARAEALDSGYRTVLDMDSTENPVYGAQEQSAYNGHFESTCFHPLLLFSRDGDWGVKYAIRIAANENLERDVAELLPRPAGRPSHKPIVWYKSLLYKAASWTAARRVVAKVEHHAGELFPRIGFVVTNLTLPSRAVVRFYNRRGTAEQWIKEGKQAVKMTRLSCHRFRSNEVRLWLSVIAYHLGNLWRRLVLPKGIGAWSLISLQQRLVKTGGRLIKHAAADSGFAAAGQIGAAARRNQSGRRRGVEGGMSEKSLRHGANHGLLVLAKAVWRTTGALALEPMQKERERRRMEVWEYIGP